MTTDKREEIYLWWREAVFGKHPVRAQIPSRILREYLDYQREISRARMGIDYSLMTLTIPQIKERGKLYYSATYGKGT